MNMHYSYSKELLSDKDVLIHHHLGLGDHIVLNGMVNHILESHNPDKKLYLLCKSSNYQNVSQLYRGKDNIEIVVSNNNEYEDANAFLKKTPGVEYLKIGHESYDHSLETKRNWDCGQVFYHLAKVPYEYRFSKFHINIDYEANLRVLETLNPNHDPYVFLHDDPARGYIIDLKNDHGLTVVRNDIRFGIFDYVMTLQLAKEIRLMPSSFYCLVESLPTITASLYCYRIRTPNFGNVTNYKWTII